MRPDSITLAIFEKYAPEELAETAQKLAQAWADKETAESEKKVSDAVFKERINKHEADVAQLATRYNKGGETAQIGCTIRYDTPTVGKKSYIRMDTEAVVEVHDMTLEEKQQTIQFPLTASASEEPKTPKKSKKPETPEPPAAPPAPSAITFKDIQAIAAHLAKLPGGEQNAALVDMQRKITTTLLAQKTAIAPEGHIVEILSEDAAEKLAVSWLKLAMQEATTSPAEEVTRICPYPACILFADHEGEHEFPKADPEAQPHVEAEPQRQKEIKPKRKKRGFVPPTEPPCQEGPDTRGIH